MIFSVAMLAMVDGGAKLVAADGLYPFLTAFFRNLFGMIAMAPYFLRRGLRGLKTDRLAMHLGRGGLHAGAMLCWFTALTLVPLAEATAISFSSPVFASIGAVLILGETSRLIRWTSVVIGFAGMLTILRPGFVDLDLGAALLITGAVCMAGVKLMVKTLSRTDAPATTVGYMSIALTLYTLVAALFVWQWPGGRLLFMLAAMGVLGTAAHVVQTYSYRDGEVTLVEPSGYVRLVWAAPWDFSCLPRCPTAGLGPVVSSLSLAPHSSCVRKSERLAPRGQSQILNCRSPSPTLPRFPWCQTC